MKISMNTVVTMSYEIRDAENNILNQARNPSPIFMVDTTRSFQK